MMGRVEFLKKRWQLVLIAVLVLAVAGTATYFAVRGNDDNVVQPTANPAPPADPTPGEEPTLSEAPTSEPATDPTTSEPDARLEDCGPIGETFVPVRYTMENPQVDASVVSLGLDDDGAIAAPPKNEPTTASWWNQGPEAGSDKGKTVLSIHTYRNGGAQGNRMYQGGESQLQEGDLIKLYGAGGEVACYEFTEDLKVWVDEYDPDSDVMVDYDGDPLLTIIICWDHRAGTDIWDSRIFFYAQPVTAA